MPSNSLLAILVPPDNPVEAPSLSDWESFERDHFRLPSDYKRFLTRYGTGDIDHFLAILNPFAKNDNLNLVRHGKAVHDAYRELSLHHPDFHPDPVHPDRDGIMVCGVTDNGDFVFWKTSADPEKWTIVVAGSQGLRPRRFDLCLTEFLYRLITKQITCTVFPHDFPSNKPEFHPVGA